MPVIEKLLSHDRLRRAIWKVWYRFVTWRLRGDDVLFLNYAFAEDPPLQLALAAEDEPNRACIQLYQHVATQVDLQGKSVLEVSCGHGGGASYLTRTLHPKRYLGLDLNSAGIAFCRQRHRVAGLDFVVGDAEKLPFANGTFDVVINVEASHCYPSFARFLAEVARVLRLVYVSMAEEVTAFDITLFTPAIVRITCSRLLELADLRIESRTSRTCALATRTCKK